jgi:hypothetical protein
VGQARRGGGRPGARGDEPGAVVAPRAQRDRAPHQRDGRDQHQRQRPPALARVGAHLLAPADRRQPRERAVADVARRAQEVRGADRAAGDPVHRRRALTDLGRHGGDAREHEPDAGHRGAERERACRGRACPDHRERHQRAEQHLGGRDDDQRRGDRREAPDRRRADQLAAPVLLLRPRVAADDEHAHQRDEGGAEAAELPRDVAAHRGEIERRADHRDQAGVALDGCDVGGAGGLGRIGLLAGGRGLGHQQHEQQHVDRDPHPLAAQGEREQRAGPGQRLHSISSP